jgi:hypothetical protein
MQIKPQRLLYALPLILLLVGLYLVPIGIFETNFSKIPGDYGDSRFNNYILEHGYQSLIGNQKDFWNAPFMYPYPNVVALSDNLFGTMPIYSVFRLLSIDRETSYQLWLIVLFILNFVCSFWVLKKWSGDIVSSSVGAYIYTFSIFILGHIYNVQSFPRFIIPFVFLWTWQYLNHHKKKYLILALIGIVFQFYCAIYLGFFLLYNLLFFVIAYFIIYKDKAFFYQFKNIKNIIIYILIGTATYILFSPLINPYIDITKKLGFRNFSDTFSSIPTLRSYFFTSNAPVIWAFLSQHGMILNEWWCHHLFMGIIPWIAIISVPLFLFSKKISSTQKKLISFFSIGLALSVIFCLKINDFTLYKIIFQLPGFSAMRAINRVINVQAFFFILIFVFLFSTIKENKKYGWLVYLFPILIILDNLIRPQEVKRFNKKDSQIEISSITDKIKNQYTKNHEAIAYIPISSVDPDKFKIHLSAMLASQSLNIPCVNAYTGSYPNQYLSFFNNTNEKSLESWCIFNQIQYKSIQKIYDLDVKVDSVRTTGLLAFNNKYLCADNNKSNFVLANRDSAWEWETFVIIFFEGNKCAIRAYNELFLCAELDKQGQLTHSRKNIGNWEKFNFIMLNHNQIAFKADNGKYLSVDKENLNIIAQGKSLGARERFTLINKL